MYCPIIPKQINCNPPTNKTTATIVGLPIGNDWPKTCSTTYEVPKMKEVAAAKKPRTVDKLSNADENPIIPFKPIFNEPKNRL